MTNTKPAQASDEAMRSAFEAWTRTNHWKFVHLNRSSSGGYAHPGIDADWLVWQAATPQPPVTPAPAGSAPALPLPGTMVIQPPEFYKYNPDGIEGMGDRAALWVYGQLVGWRIAHLSVQPAPAQAYAVRPTDDTLWDKTLKDRDAYHEWADKLADAISKHFSVDIGEHSNQNLPWSEALDAIMAQRPAQGEALSQKVDGGLDKDGNHADDLRHWLGEARSENEKVNVAFMACSLKLKQAEAELARRPTSTAPTDISARLRNYVESPLCKRHSGDKLMLDAADEIERYYGGMMNWKRSAENNAIGSVERGDCPECGVGYRHALTCKFAQPASKIEAPAASTAPAQAAPDDVRDAARLDFMIDRQAFIMVIPDNKNGGRAGYQLMEQDEDEEYQVISGEGIMYSTSREAIDVAMSATRSGQ